MLSNAGNAALLLVNTLLDLYTIAVMLRFILQIVPADPYNPLAQFMIRVTDPPLGLLRRIVPRYRRIDTAALVLMAGILLLHFDHWLKPALVLLEVPLAFGGAAAALAASGIGLNLLGLVGFITLIGISLNHAIVLFDRVARNEAAGKPLDDAVAEAVAARLRPIVLTTLTAVLGALPTAVGWGIGAAPEQGLAVVLVGGMLWTSLLSANLIPALYLRLRRRRLGEQA